MSSNRPKRLPPKYAQMKAALREAFRDAGIPPISDGDKPEWTLNGKPIKFAGEWIEGPYQALLEGLDPKEIQEKTWGESDMPGADGQDDGQDAGPRPIPTPDGDLPTDPMSMVVLDLIRRYGHKVLQLPEIDATLDEEAVEAIVRKLMSRPSFTVTVQDSNGATTHEIEGLAHKSLGQMLRLAGAGIENMMLVGPSGTGKTTAAKQLAEALGRKFFLLCGSPGTSPSDLQGMVLLDGRPVKMGFVEAFESQEPMLLCIDEMDKLDPGILSTLNSALSLGRLDVYSRAENPVAYRGDVLFVATANTWGHGPSRTFVSSQQQDAATLDRFTGGQLWVDYDADLESRLGPAPLVKWVQDLRLRVEKAMLPYQVTTRWIVQGARLMASGFSLEEVRAALLVSWPHDTRQRVGEVG